jgi:hypothetical protein
MAGAAAGAETAIDTGAGALIAASIAVGEVAFQPLTAVGFGMTRPGISGDAGDRSWASDSAGVGRDDSAGGAHAPGADRGAGLRSDCDNKLSGRAEQEFKWGGTEEGSGRGDLNSRPPAPKAAVEVLSNWTV